jgi:adenylate cyclase
MTGEPDNMMREAIAEVSLLVAEVTGASSLSEKLGAAEAARAVERALARAERSVHAYQGSRVGEATGRLAASFARGDGAALAANDMIKRINQLPPVSGISLSVRVVLHTGRCLADGSIDPESIAQSFNLLSFATPGKILVSNEVVGKLSEGMRANLVSAPQMSVHIGTQDVPLLELQSGNLIAGHSQGPLTVPPPQPTIMPSATPLPPSRSASAAEGLAQTRLLLRYHGASLLVSEFKTSLMAGREESNDLVISDRRASRQHARIEWRDGRFLLVDHSTNGTYLLDDHGVEILLRHGECELPPHGRIGCGYSPLEAGCEPMVFDIGERQQSAA